MGTFVAIEGAKGNICAGDAAKFLVDAVEELVAQLIDKKVAILILDDFDIWAPIKRIEPSLEQEKVDNFEGHSKSLRSKEPVHQPTHRTLWEKFKTSVVAHKGVDDKVTKIKLSWVYQVLYLFRHSLGNRLDDDGLRLICIALYGNPGATQSFFDDIFEATYKQGEFYQKVDQLNLPFVIPQSGTDIGYNGDNIEAIGRYIDTTLLDNLNRTVRVNPLYRSATAVVVNNDVLHVPFDVKCGHITLPKITVICGEKQSGKTTLLNAISKAWIQGEAVCIANTLKSHHCKTHLSGPDIDNTAEGRTYGQPFDEYNTGDKIKKPEFGIYKDSRNRSLYKLEYYNIFSQYVGCGESYIRHTFHKARNNKPALIILDQLELLFGDTSHCVEDWYGLETISRTLINELDALDDGVAFIAATGGSLMPGDLPRVITNLNNTTVVLTK
ncbi:spermatogenesis-associated protein, putative [Babesia ovis]|uniref:Spermatogenesis-associated protein, putative n=1 Tax=Babesia ovis TaxID=5869 RepID=A0A9W5TEE7_BABOV|nr:spermatogenesis-associated protein, putative [Babesia ovis]